MQRLRHPEVSDTIEHTYSTMSDNTTTQQLRSADEPPVRSVKVTYVYGKDQTGDRCPGCHHSFKNCTCSCLECGRLVLSCRCDDFDPVDSDSDSYVPYYTSPSHRAPICDEHKASGKVDRDCHVCEQLACDEEAKEKLQALMAAKFPDPDWTPGAKTCDRAYPTAPLHGKYHNDGVGKVRCGGPHCLCFPETL